MTLAVASASAALRAACGRARLAPSTHNTQPWSFLVVEDEDAVEIVADRRRALRAIDPEGRELVASCGAALHHVCVALRHEGREPMVHRHVLGTDARVIARVAAGQAVVPTAQDEALYGAIDRRHTVRGPFEDRAVPRELLEELRDLAAEHGTRMQLIESHAVRELVADLVGEATRAQWHDRAYRRELAGWLRSNADRRRDGLPGHVFGWNDAVSMLAPLAIRARDMGASQASGARAAALTAPHLVMFETARDAPNDWLAAGEALSAVLLRASLDGVVASFLDQPIQLAAFRPRLVALTGAEGHPQLLLRLGYAAPARPTPRRALPETLM